MSSLYHAIIQLYPGADPRRDFLLQDDGAGPYIAAWRLADPEPTAEQLAAASAAYDAAQQQAAQEDATLKQEILSLVQSAVGVRYNLLTAAQRNAIAALDWYRRGLLDRQGRVKPPGEWGG